MSDEMSRSVRLGVHTDQVCARMPLYTHVGTHRKVSRYLAPAWDLLGYTYI